MLLISEIQAFFLQQVPTSSTSTAINGSIKKEIEEEEDRPPVARVKQEIVSSDEEMEQKSRRSKREAKRGEKILPVVTIKKEIKTETEDLAVEDKKNTKNNEKKRSCGEASFSGASPPKKVHFLTRRQSLHKKINLVFLTEKNGSQWIRAGSRSRSEAKIEGGKVETQTEIQ